METGKSKLEKNCFGQTKREELSSSAHVLIEHEIDQLSLSIIDSKAKQCIGLCAFPLDLSLSDVERRAEVKQLFKTNPLVTFPFSKRQIMIANRECVFVPEEIFRKEDQDKYIDSSFENDYPGKVFSQANPLLKNILVYKLSDWFLDAIDEHFSGSIFSHSTSFLADALFRLSRQNEDQVVHAHFKRSFFELFIFNNGKMLFYNSFNYQTSEDIAYFIMYALKQWNMQSNEISLSGIFNKKSDELHWLKKYAGDLIDFPVSALLPYPASIPNPTAYINLLNPSSCE